MTNNRINLSTSIKYLRSNRTEWVNEIGQLYREDGPAIEYDDGSKEWYAQPSALANAC